MRIYLFPSLNIKILPFNFRMKFNFAGPKKFNDNLLKTTANLQGKFSEIESMKLDEYVKEVHELENTCRTE